MMYTTSRLTKYDAPTVEVFAFSREDILTWSNGFAGEEETFEIE